MYNKYIIRSEFVLFFADCCLLQYRIMAPCLLVTDPGLTHHQSATAVVSCLQLSVFIVGRWVPGGLEVSHWQVHPFRLACRPWPLTTGRQQHRSSAPPKPHPTTVTQMPSSKEARLEAGVLALCTKRHPKTC